jgi:hypothetical protein
MAMTMDEILAFVAERFTDVTTLVASEENGAPRAAWGDAFFTYAPPADSGRPAPRMPFATIVTQDYHGFDEASRLDRLGVFRLNVSVGRGAFDRLLGAGWADRTYVPAAFDVVMPHPVYAGQGWLCILNPSDGSRPTVVDLLTDAHGRAVAQHRR